MPSGFTPPQAPQRANFYTMVCNGSWLDPERWNDAVATHRTEKRQFTEWQDGLFFRQTQAPPLASNRPADAPFPAELVNPTLPQRLLQPLVNGVVALATVVVIRPLEQLAQVANQSGQAMGRQLSGLERAMAQLFSYFLGHQREARPHTSQTEQERDTRDKNDFLLRLTDLFALNKVGGSSQVNLSGGNQQRR